MTGRLAKRGLEEKEENENEIAKRRCVKSVAAEALDIGRHGEEFESCGNSWCDLWDDPGGLSDGDRGGWVSVLCVHAVFFLQKSARFVWVVSLPRRDEL